MKKRILTKLFALLLIGGMFACSDDDNANTNADNPSPEEFNITSGYTGVTFDQEAVILGVRGKDASDMRVSLMYLLSNMKQQVTDNTKLLIVPELSSEYEKAIKTVYENGGVIGVTNPSQAQISKWFETVDWNEGFMPDNVDDALMFSFGKGFHCCVVYGPNNKDIFVDSADVANMPDKDSEGFIFKPMLEAQENEGEVTYDGEASSGTADGTDEVVDLDNSKYPDVYTYLSAWIDNVNKSFSEKDVVDEEETAMVKQFISQKITRANGDGGTSQNDVSVMFSKYPYSTVLPFSASKFIRQVIWSDPDSIRGEGTVSLNLNIYQIHCYDESSSPGDYYLINMSAALASDKMYRGKWVNKHGWIWDRLCGLYAKSFTVDCLPWNSVKDEPYYSDEVATIGTPSPETTVGQTKYTTGSSFGLGLGFSVSAGKNNKKNEQNQPIGGNFLSAGVTVSGGWTWTDSKSRQISDTDISNLSGYYVINGKPQSISRVGWKMTFNNLPKFQYSQYRGFNEGNSQTYRSTNYLDASWIWYAKNPRDYSTESPISIKVRTQASYGALSWYTSKADLIDLTFNDIACLEYTFKLMPFSRDKCASIELQNDFTDGTIITSVDVFRFVDKEKEKIEADSVKVWSTASNLEPGKSVTTSAFTITDKYMIYFTTSNGKKYKYDSYDFMQLQFGLPNTVYSSADFKETSND